MKKLIKLFTVMILTGACAARPVGECPDWAEPQAREKNVVDICDGLADEGCNAVMRFAAEVTSHTGVIVIDGRTMGNGVVIGGGRVLTALHVSTIKETGEPRGKIFFQIREMDLESGEPIGCNMPIEMAIEATANQAGVEAAILVPVHEEEAGLLPAPIIVASSPPAIGSTVWQFGQRSRWARGTVTSDGLRSYINIDMAGQPGDSGGALVDEQGRLLGVIYGGNAEVGYAEASSVTIMREVGLI
jgi:hypothetical protein